MASDLRRGVALGNQGTQNPASIYSFPNQRHHLMNTRTRWVRFWADWTELQPDASNTFEAPAWGYLDEQIRGAVNANSANPDEKFYVVVTAYRCPWWANEVRRTDLGIGKTEQGKFVVPDHLGVNYTDKFGQVKRTPWSLFIEHLTIRYNPANPANGGAFVHCVEVMNEPNIQMQPLWENPQDPPQNWRPIIHKHAADMMRTAQAVKNGTEPNAPKEFWPILLGPATGDTEEKSTVRMPYDQFTQALIDELARTSFKPGGWYGWSHHNHRDIEVNGGGTGFYLGDQRNRAVHARDLIKNKWYGWPDGDQTNPRIFLTEGGGRLNKIKTEWFEKKGLAWDGQKVRDMQAKLLQNQINRMTEAAGIVMMMQYLVTSSFAYDCGIREAYTYGSEAKFV
jgi:hypothetical protein